MSITMLEDMIKAKERIAELEQQSESDAEEIRRLHKMMKNTDNSVRGALANIRKERDELVGKLEASSTACYDLNAKNDSLLAENERLREGLTEICEYGKDIAHAGIIAREALAEGKL